VPSVLFHVVESTYKPLTVTAGAEGSSPVVPARGAAVSPDGKWLYATDWNAGRGNLVTVFDASTLVIEARITVGKFPEEVAFSADSLVAYVASGGAGGNVPAVFLPVPGSKSSIASSRSGLLQCSAT
jgi:YVTN family beta-propeller protein